MRFSSGLFMALATASASLVMGQGNSTFIPTSSSISTTTISPTSSGTEPSGSAGPPVSVDLGGANLGPGASFITLSDGSTAVLLSAGPNGQASFSISTPDLPDGITTGDLISLLFDILVSLLENSRRRAVTDCTLEVTINGQSVFVQTLETTSGFAQQSSSGTPAEDTQDIVFTQTCGDNPATLQVAHLQIAAGSGGGGGTTTGGSSSTISVPTGNTTATATNTGTKTGTKTGTSATSTATSISGFPGTIGDFVLFGCVGSTAGFPTFRLAQSSGSMDLNTCASACEGRSFFGVYDDDCYCGDSIDDSNTNRVPIDQCDIECPGDDAQFCGGDRILQRRQSVPNTIFLTVYISLGGSTVTTTVTTESVITTTVTGASTTETKTVTAIYECFDGKCFPDGGNGIIVWIFNPYPGSECDGLNVWVIESCSCKGGQQYVPKYCSNGDCEGLTVYKAEECKDWYNQDVYYTASKENGTVVYKPWEDTWGTPEHPAIAEVPTCSGAGCPVGTATTSSSGSHSTSSGGDTPDVVVGSASKSAVSAVAYIAALMAAFL